MKTPADLRVDIARNLREVRRMYASLRAQAVAAAGDHELPGGEAMVLLGPAADVEAFGYRQLSVIFGRIDADAIELDSLEPPIAFLRSWASTIHEQRTGRELVTTQASMAALVGYLAAALDWITRTDDEGKLAWTEASTFASKLHAHRSQLERVLHDGKQVDRGAPCFYCGTPLTKTWAGSVRHPLPERFDSYSCARCDLTYSADDYQRATNHAFLLNADWLIAPAIAQVYRVPVGTVVSWAARGQVRKRKDHTTGRVTYNVADVLTRRDGTLA